MSGLWSLASAMKEAGVTFLRHDTSFDAKVENLRTAGPNAGESPYLQSFRLVVNNPLPTGETEYTVTITESFRNGR